MTRVAGLLFCGVCGGAVAKRGNNRFGCVSHIMGKGCTNSRTIVRDVLETRVLAGLQDRLMEPEAFAEAMRSFIEETNRLNHLRRANRGADVERLEEARKAIGGIVAAIEDGGYSRPLMERLRRLEVEVEEIETKLAEAPRDVPDIHPNVAELHRRKVGDCLKLWTSPRSATRPPRRCGRQSTGSCWSQDPRAARSWRRYTAIWRPFWPEPMTREVSGGKP
ncbi:zinc ribbon domain-containing protein [Phenylobacterium sp. Root700]|uniref:zinc ribbon domain-containing protein n=1 Tax=Phenylobacterium sp. Root700 TaxID=1736591 RepID=UPI0006F8E1B1|nr:zinc ribbon domain-containing protein [Phenylobacterium sp. Root700]KRB49552.1 hypothetical protein ASE02_17240 [Phenylobacterium sp. Root700]